MYHRDELQCLGKWYKEGRHDNACIEAHVGEAHVKRTHTPRQKDSRVSRGLHILTIGETAKIKVDYTLSELEFRRENPGNHLRSLMGDRPKETHATHTTQADNPIKRTQALCKAKGRAPHRSHTKKGSEERQHQ